MDERITVLKTYKLFIDGKFPRSESGRSMRVDDTGGSVYAHLCKASRKDLRDAVEAARRAQPGWAAATAYNRGQVLYRAAEMLEARRAEFAEALAVGAPKRRKGGAVVDEVSMSVDRLVCFAGWADKYAQVLGCNNPVAGPYYNFTSPEPTGVVAVVAPDRPALLGLVSLLAPVICSGNTAVVLASEAFPVAAAVLGEVLATSDVPAGVVNILTGERAELIPQIATHRDIDGVHAAGLPPEHGAALRAGVAENLKRVRVHADPDWTDGKACGSPWWIEPFVEMKTVWHPAGA
ncbi:MAG: aldehyde dehydrogenase family protein [Phycisphaerales bacterium]